MEVRNIVSGGVVVVTGLALASLGAGTGALPSDGGAATQSGSPSTAAVGSSRPARCGTSFNAYTASSSTIKECGYSQYPRKSTRTTSDGSTIYTYDVDGATTTYTTPPPLFDAATASATELAKYGIPPAPSASNATAYAQWHKMINNLHFVIPPKALVSINVRAGASRSVYTTSSTSQISAQADESYIRRSLDAYPCSSSYVPSWSGIGARNSGQLNSLENPTCTSNEAVDRDGG